MPKDGLAVARKYRDAARTAGSQHGLGAKGVDNFTSDIEKIVPDLRQLTREMVWNEIYSREELDMKQRSVVVLSSLITQGVEPEVRHLIQMLVIYLLLSIPLH